MPEMLGVAAGEFEVLRAVRSEHGPEIHTVDEPGDPTAPGRAHLPAMWRRFPASNKVLRTVRQQHVLKQRNVPDNTHVYSL